MREGINWIFLVTCMSLCYSLCQGFRAARPYSLRPWGPGGGGLLIESASRPFSVPSYYQNPDKKRLSIDSRCSTFRCHTASSREPFEGSLCALPNAAQGGAADPFIQFESDANIATANKTLAAIRSGLLFGDVFGAVLPRPSRDPPEDCDLQAVHDADEIKAIAESLDFFVEAFGQFHEAAAEQDGPRAAALRRLMELGVRRRLRQFEMSPGAVSKSRPQRSIGKTALSALANVFRRIPLFRSAVPLDQLEAKNIKIDLVFEAVLRVFDLNELKNDADRLKTWKKLKDNYFFPTPRNTVGAAVRGLTHASELIRFPSRQHQIVLVSAVLLSLVPIYWDSRVGPMDASCLTLLSAHALSLACALGTKMTTPPSPIIDVDSVKSIAKDAGIEICKVSVVSGSLTLLLSLLSPSSTRAQAHAALWATSLIAASLSLHQRTQEGRSDAAIHSESSVLYRNDVLNNPLSLLSQPVKIKETEIKRNVSKPSDNEARQEINEDDSWRKFLSEFKRAAEIEDSKPLMQQPDNVLTEEDDDEDDEEALSRFDSTDDTDDEGDYRMTTADKNQLDAADLLDDDREDADSASHDFTLHSFGGAGASNRLVDESTDEAEANEAVGDADLLLQQELSRLAETGYLQDEDDYSSHSRNDWENRDPDMDE